MKYLNKLLILAVILIIITGGCASDRFGRRPTKWVALTFNGGPSFNTETLLDIMKGYDAKATFFLSGFHLSRDIYAPVVQRMLDEGHEIANYAFTHVDMSVETSRQHIRENIERAQNLIRDITGKDNILFRPPDLRRNDLVDDVVRAMRLVYIGGYSPNDWDVFVGPSLITELVVENARNGKIIVLHDYGNSNIVDALPDILWELRNLGYGFVTVSELAQLNRVRLVPGRWYDSF